MNTEYIRELRASQAALAEKADAIIKAGEARGHFTNSERKSLKSMEAEAQTLKSDLDEALDPATAERTREDQALLAQFKSNGAFDIGGSFTDSGDARLAVHPAGIKSTARELSSRLVTDRDGQKALISGGQATATVIARDMSTLPQVPTSILSLVPVVALDSPTYRYLKQVGPRENNAAVVKPGEVKPTSPMSLEPVEGSLVTVAHLSDGISKYDLLDTGNLQRFVESELRYGLATKMEDLVINGSGEEGEPLGLLKHSGVLTQAFETDLVTSVRKAITQIEAQGYAPSAIALRPEQWEQIELLTASGSGEYVVNSPVDRAARRLFGIQVVVSNALEAGTAMVADLREAVVFNDRRGLMAEWTQNSGDDFERNLLRVRVETRVNVGLGQPSGIVQVATSA